MENFAATVLVLSGFAWARKVRDNAQPSFFISFL